MIFDHIGLVTADLSRGRQFLASTLEVTLWTEEFQDPGIGVIVQFGKSEAAGAPWYELITPLGDQSPVAAALRSGKNILNHVAYLVEDIEQSGKKLRENRCFPVDAPKPAVAYGGQRVQFFVSPLRFMIEIIEAAEHKHKILRDELGD